MRDLGVDELRDPEVGDLDLVALAQDEVRRFDVAVHDAARVSVVERGRDLAHERDHPLGLEADALVDDGGDRLAVDELHRQERQPVLLADVEQRDDARVGECPRDARLLVEALDEGPVLRAVARDVEADRLDRQRALDERVERLVDGSHRTEAERAGDLVAPDGSGDLVARRRPLVAHVAPRVAENDTYPRRIRESSTRLPFLSNARDSPSRCRRTSCGYDILGSRCPEASARPLPTRRSASP